MNSRISSSVLNVDIKSLFVCSSGAFNMHACTDISFAVSPNVSSNTVTNVCTASIASATVAPDVAIHTVLSYASATIGSTNLPMRAHFFGVYPAPWNIDFISSIFAGAILGAGASVRGLGTGIVFCCWGPRCAGAGGKFGRMPDGDIGRGGVGRCDAGAETGVCVGVGVGVGAGAGVCVGCGNTIFWVDGCGIWVGSIKNVCRRPRSIRYSPVNPITIAPISDM